MKRGRKSSADLAIVTPIGAARPQPPDSLTTDQSAVWRDVVERLPANWFPRETLELLAAYCRHVLSHRFLSSLVDAVERKGAAGLSTDDDLAAFNKALAMRDREAKAMIATARALRITKASQTRPETAYRAAAGNPAGARRPWERAQ